jgi:hypothetical protein
MKYLSDLLSSTVSVEISSPITIQGPFLVSENKTVTSIQISQIFPATSGPKIIVEGCAQFAGTLNITIDSATVLTGITNFTLATFSDGYCGGAPSTFINSSLTVLQPCTEVDSYDLEYQPRSLVLVMQVSHPKECSNVTAAQESPAAKAALDWISIASVAGVVVGLAICLALLYRFRRKIIPSLSMLRATTILRRRMESVERRRPSTDHSFGESKANDDSTFTAK